VKLGIRRPVGLVQWAVLVACGLFASAILLLVLAMALAMGGTLNSSPLTEITQRKPWVDFIGSACRLVTDVRAIAWNDYPDKAKILEVTLMAPPWVKNRFVSYETPLKPDQTVRIVSAWQQFAFFGYNRHYVVSVPGAGLADDIPVWLDMNADGVPDPQVCEPVDK